MSTSVPSIRVPTTGTLSVPTTGTLKKERFARTPSSVLFDKELTFQARLIYGMLAMHTMQGNTASMGYRRISDKLGMSKSTVGSGLSELEARGHITVRRPRPEEKQNVRRIYHLNSGIFGQKQGKEDVIVSSPRGHRHYVSLDNERHNIAKSA